MIVNEKELICKVCHNPATVIWNNHPGYQIPLTYDIGYCHNCDTAFAIPLEVNDEIYNLIYENAKLVPSYNRYFHYAKITKEVNNPLKFLCESEDIYWAISTILTPVLQKMDVNIIEVGCGMGYLTYALAKTGFNVVGLDISSSAVQKATSRYGNYYICGDLLEYSEQHIGQYDYVIMTEVIEHLPDIEPFLNAAKNLLRHNGQIILTTPNKSAYPVEALWETDCPPVHLWWFSENSIRYLAKNIGCSVEFLDLDLCKIADWRALKKDYDWTKPTGKPTFDADGTLLIAIEMENKYKKRARKFLAKIGVFKSVKQIRNMIGKRKTTQKPYTMCIVLRKSN